MKAATLNSVRAGRRRPLGGTPCYIQLLDIKSDVDYALRESVIRNPRFSNMQRGRKTKLRRHIFISCRGTLLKKTRIRRTTTTVEPIFVMEHKTHTENIWMTAKLIILQCGMKIWIIETNRQSKTGPRGDESNNLTHKRSIKKDSRASSSLSRDYCLAVVNEARKFSWFDERHDHYSHHMKLKQQSYSLQ